VNGSPAKNTLVALMDRLPVLTQETERRRLQQRDRRRSEVAGVEEQQRAVAMDRPPA